MWPWLAASAPHSQRWASANRDRLQLPNLKAHHRPCFHHHRPCFHSNLAGIAWMRSLDPPCGSVSCDAVSSPPPFCSVHGSQRSSLPAVGWIVRLRVSDHPGAACRDQTAQGHSHRFTSYTLLPRLPPASAESAQQNGKPESLRLLNMRGMVRDSKLSFSGK